MQVCRSCGQDVADDAAFCGCCGTPTVAPLAPATGPATRPTLPACTTCGGEPEADSRYCGFCGHPLGAPADGAIAAAYAPSVAPLPPPRPAQPPGQPAPRRPFTAGRVVIVGLFLVVLLVAAVGAYVVTRPDRGTTAIDPRIAPDEGSRSGQAPGTSPPSSASPSPKASPPPTEIRGAGQAAVDAWSRSGGTGHEEYVNAACGGPSSICVVG